MVSFISKHKGRCILLVCCILILYWIFMRPIAEIKMVGIDMEDAGIYNEQELKYMNLDSQQIDDVLNNPQKYKFVIYHFNISNISSRRMWGYVTLKPKFNNEFKKIVVYYQPNCDTESPIFVDPLTKHKMIQRRILVRVDGKADIEIKKLAQKNKFYISGYTTGESLFDIGYNFKIVKCNGN